MSGGYVISGDPKPAARVTRSLLVVDTDGIVHVAREYVRPVLGYENSVIEEPIEVTDFTGKSVGRAEQVLTEEGLEVEITEENSDTVPEGKVISQTPASGTLFRGDTVQLVASKGPAMVQVPPVRGVGVDEAVQRLEQVGDEAIERRARVDQQRAHARLDRSACAFRHGYPFHREGFLHVATAGADRRSLRLHVGRRRMGDAD